MNSRCTSSYASLPSSCSVGRACAMSSSSGVVSIRSLASCSGGSTSYSRRPPPVPSNGALYDWMVTSNPYHRSARATCSETPPRRRRYRSSSRTRNKLEQINENLEPIRIDTILAPALFFLFVATIKAIKCVV
ncbi:hypothetical protein EGW08_020446 [Elysia chlorotica]|uniref:Uncharacterized protein n=1 Tax=Elysia chlorotica TaxID=188477 RepID=A0A433SRD7_ELYCH|nr:hypothetical protein EGW08_020446 [Elysia chlorotica]